MSCSAERRLQKDLKRLVNEDPEGINASPCEDNLLFW
jgi:ubiquitin-protein ligase